MPHTRFLFIKQDKRRGDARRTLFIVRCDERHPSLMRFQVSNYDDIVDRGLLSPTLAGGEPAEPLLLVCTHGKHDRCCAKYGLPVYRHLRQLAAGSAWEASHVGGDRFAANVLCFPHGLYYGHVTVDSARDIVDAYCRQEIYLANYRGRSCYSRFEQIGESFARSSSGLLRVDDLVLRDTSALTENRWLARFDALHGVDTHSVIFELRETGLKSIRTCGSREEKPITEYALVSYTAERRQ